MKIQPPKYNWRPHKYGTISLCMIAKNEEKRLYRCIKSVEELVNEIIIVDTGSEDNTIKIAKSLGAKVFRQDWEDDFSKPRNYSLSKATMDWILIMDPDEVINKRDHAQIRSITAQTKYLAFQLPTRNYGRNPREQGFISKTDNYPEAHDWPGYVPSTKTRFFRNGLNIQFRGCWHELVDPYVVENKIPIIYAEIPIHHWSNEISQKSHKEKQTFYLHMGEKKVRENPNDDQAWWELAVSEAIAGLRTRAAYSIGMSLRKGFTVSKRMFALSRVLRMLNQKQKANFAFEKAICLLYPTLTHIDPVKKTYLEFIPT